MPARSLRAARLRRALLHALGGAVFGYVILHPVAMSIFRWLDHPQAGPAAGHGLSGPLQGMVESFHGHMLPMGLLFGVLCAAIGAMDGYLRAALAHQRDRLAAELDLNVAYREELERTLAQVRELELANRRATRFMVHDFKNHLACILGFSGQLRARAGEGWDDEASDAVERIHRQGLRMLGAVTDLLDLARLGEGPSLSPKDVWAEALLAEAAHDLSLPSRHGHIEVGSGAKSCPPLSGDARLLGRVLVNLAVNAFKHNSAGTRVVLDAQARGSDPTEVTFSCHDDGKGIPIDELQTIFDEFKTGDQAGGSSGLGLAFCKAAVEAHGGHIWCESAEGTGATFYFTIPLAGAVSLATGPAPHPVPSARMLAHLLVRAEGVSLAK